jgi:hypothetical protein
MPRNSGAKAGTRNEHRFAQADTSPKSGDWGTNRPFRDLVDDVRCRRLCSHKRLFLFSLRGNIRKRKAPMILRHRGFGQNGAGEETRTLDVHLGKVVLYQLSYARKAGCKE